MVIKNGTHRLVGFVDLGEGHDLMNSLAGRVRVHFYYIEVQELQKWQSLEKKKMFISSSLLNTLQKNNLSCSGYRNDHERQTWTRLSVDGLSINYEIYFCCVNSRHVSCPHAYLWSVLKTILLSEKGQHVRVAKRCNFNNAAGTPLKLRLHLDVKFWNTICKSIERMSQEKLKKLDMLYT